MEDCIKKKTSIFLCSKINHRLTLLLDEDIPRDLLHKVGIIIIYYRLLKYKEISFIQIKDIVVKNR